MRVLKGILNWAVAGAWLSVASAYLGFLGTRWLPSSVSDAGALLIYVITGLILSALALSPFWNRRMASRFGTWIVLPIAIVTGYVTWDLRLQEPASWQVPRDRSCCEGWVCDPYPYPWKEVEPGDIGQCVLHASTRDH
jgi:hypothetical protein